MSARKPKRFYERAAVEEEDGGFAIVLDGRPVLTPAGARLKAPSRRLAEAIAAEWQAQGSDIRPESMPITRLANAALDGVAARRDEVIAATVAFAATDLLCYRAAAPAALRERQDREWQPLLDWAAEAFGARLAVTAGVVPLAQPKEAVAALEAVVAALDDLALAGLSHLTAALGSLLLALAVAEGRVEADEAFALAHLDESWQMEAWGEDFEAAERLRRIRAEVTAAADFLAHLRG